MTYEKKLNYIIEKAYKKDDYYTEYASPGIIEYVFLIEKILKRELTLEFYNPNSIFYRNLAPEDKLDKIADFTYDMYRYYCDSPELDIKDKFEQEYELEVQRCNNLEWNISLI